MAFSIADSPSKPVCIQKHRPNTQINFDCFQFPKLLENIETSRTLYIHHKQEKGKPEKLACTWSNSWNWQKKNSYNPKDQSLAEKYALSVFF